MMANVELIFRIFIASICGSLIGYERTNRNKGAGVRTHAIVALSSALIMIISKYGFFDINDYDASRVAAQIVSGVGFLGAGIIFVRNNSVISGLTTAAGIWGTAGVGMAVGAGMYTMGIAATTMLVLIQIYFHRENFISKNEGYRFNLKLNIKSMESFSNIKNIFNEYGLQIESLNIRKNINEYVFIDIDLIIKNPYIRFEILEKILKDDNVLNGSWE